VCRAELASCRGAAPDYADDPLADANFRACASDVSYNCGMQRILGLTAGLVLLSQAQALAQMSPAAQRGFQFADTNCARCHSIDKVSPSPLPIAPPFRNLHQRYPVENLQEPLAEGIRTGHPTMPEFRLDPGQIADLIGFLRSLK